MNAVSSEASARLRRLVFQKQASHTVGNGLHPFRSLQLSLEPQPSPLGGEGGEPVRPSAANGPERSEGALSPETSLISVGAVDDSSKPLARVACQSLGPCAGARRGLVAAFAARIPPYLGPPRSGL